MSKPKLTYFDFSGSRGEECRLALFVAGVDFEDFRLKGGWSDLKASTPFGSLPVLEIPGKGSLAQSNAILTFIGRSHGLHPTDTWEAAQHEALMSASEHLRHQISATNHIEDEGEKKTAREVLVAGPLPLYGRSVEAQLGDGPFVAGKQINVVDIKLYMMLRWVISGALDDIPNTLFSEHPRLMKLYESVSGHPKIAEWVNRA
jgi:glutathione S-transferase